LLWLRKAAEQHDSLACHNLAVLYSQGKGIPADPIEAKKWLDKAADAGNSQKS